MSVMEGGLMSVEFAFIVEVFIAGVAGLFFLIVTISMIYHLIFNQCHASWMSYDEAGKKLRILDKKNPNRDESVGATEDDEGQFL